MAWQRATNDEKAPNQLFIFFIIHSSRVEEAGGRPPPCLLACSCLLAWAWAWDGKTRASCSVSGSWVQSGLGRDLGESELDRPLEWETATRETRCCWVVRSVEKPLLGCGTCWLSVPVRVPVRVPERKVLQRGCTEMRRGAARGRKIRSAYFTGQSFFVVVVVTHTPEKNQSAVNNNSGWIGSILRYRMVHSERTARHTTGRAGHVMSCHVMPCHEYRSTTIIQIIPESARPSIITLRVLVLVFVCVGICPCWFIPYLDDCYYYCMCSVVVIELVLESRTGTGTGIVLDHSTTCSTRLSD